MLYSRNRVALSGLLAAGVLLACLSGCQGKSSVDEITIMLPGDVPLALMHIPAGTFMMGSPDDESGRWDLEGPQHQVTLTQDYYLGKYPLTQAQWLAVMGSWPDREPSSGVGVGDDYPAYFVSWDDAQDFITALNTHVTNTGQGPATFRLPTEAEWEYACRAGTTTRFYFGDSLGCDNHCEDCAAGVLPGNRSDYMWYCDETSGSKPVGGKLPNAFGLYDMHGTIFEWCQDWSWSYSSDPVTDPTGPTSSPYRVNRGGSWVYNVRLCRSAARGYSSPGNRERNLGFRLAR